MLVNNVMLQCQSLFSTARDITTSSYCRANTPTSVFTQDIKPVMLVSKLHFHFIILSLTVTIYCILNCLSCFTLQFGLAHSLLE